PLRAADFLGEAGELAARLPAGEHVINVCEDRYRFAVGLAASLLARKICLLPPTRTPEVIRQLAAFAPDVFCLTDEDDCDVALAQMHFPPPSASRTDTGRSPWRVPEIDVDQIAAYVFTSGSTGLPVPYPKSWGKLVRCVRDGAARLGFADGRSHAVLATVPPQHMYGFESSVLLALQSSGALCAERPFYPADVCSALEALPHPRTLISTPIHLRALLASQTQLPAADLIVSATAPLPRELAREAEQRFQAPLLEIYGSTESGQLATRRTARDEQWRLWPGVCLTLEEGRAWARGGHLEQPTPMCDELQPLDTERFLLRGRLADLVNIAGKRSSLSYLTHQLTSVAGVDDGVFFFPEEPHPSEAGVTRVAAAVVAPGLDAARLLEALRQRIDAVFLPRPLLFVERLPRNNTGKLPREALRSLAAASVSASESVAGMSGQRTGS
ncbi:MAG TPA: AMP-binding protein, partial [Steroidobacteraceae bacterium]|nr:AMP-binding protein [Steroidobacteraceae bacterium]